MAIEFKRFRLSIKKIDTLRDYVTFFIRDWRSVLVKILDACCGSKMFWFDKENPNVTYMDIRRYSDILKENTSEFKHFKLQRLNKRLGEVYEQ